MSPNTFIPFDTPDADGGANTLAIPPLVPPGTPSTIEIPQPPPVPPFMTTEDLDKLQYLAKLRCKSKCVPCKLSPMDEAMWFDQVQTSFVQFSSGSPTRQILAPDPQRIYLSFSDAGGGSWVYPIGSSGLRNTLGISLGDAGKSGRIELFQYKHGPLTQCAWAGDYGASASASAIIVIVSVSLREWPQG
jgi:hypothetical protein